MTYKIPGTRFRSARGLVRPGALGATDLAVDPKAGIAATATRLSTSWHPTGFYTPADVINIVSQLTKVFVPVRAPLAAWLLKKVPIGSLDVRARTALLRLDAAQAQASRYSAIAVTGMSQGMKYIDAPGLKAMVVGHLKAMAQGVREYQSIEADYNATIRALAQAATGVVAGGAMNWFLTKTELWPVVQKVGDTIIRIVGVAAEVVKEAVGAVISIPDTIGTMLKMVKWGALLFGAAFIYGEIKDHRASGG